MAIMQAENQGDAQYSDDRPVLVFKYGGNAMRDPDLQLEVLKRISQLGNQGYAVVLVHGGGPFIQKILDRVGITSEFVEGQRRTTQEAMPWVEMTLKGKVNALLVKYLQKLGVNAIGLSGKDGNTAIAEKFWAVDPKDGSPMDLGHVGKIVDVDPTLLRLLIRENYLPVMCCVASGKDGLDYNINADFFAAAIAGALQADAFILLTDIDGLRENVDDASSLISTVTLGEIKQLIDNKQVQGGMIPKLKACEQALAAGVKRCQILNGMKPEQIQSFVDGTHPGTQIVKSYATT